MSRITKRGILFSMIAVLLATFFILLFWSASTPRLDTTSGAVETRVTVMDNYVASWDAYIDDATRLSTRAALIAITEQLDAGTPIASAEQMAANISSCLKYGNTTLDAAVFRCVPGGSGTTFTERLDDFVAIGKEELNIHTNYTLSENVTVRDWFPFELLISYQLNYTINDSFVQWNRSTQHDVVVNVLGLPDPLFTKYSSAWLTVGSRNFTKFPVPRSLLTRQNLSDLIATEAYVSNTGVGMTYLQRLGRDLSAEFDPLNISGIETLIDPAITQAHAWPLNRSYTAHQIFADEIFTCGDETLGIIVTAGDFHYPKFRFDIPHLADYNMTKDVNYWNHTCT